jgi:hypothetical protein
MRTTVALVTALVLLLLPAEAPAKLRSCHTRADFNLLISSARNMRCKTARRDLRRHVGSISFRFRTPGGFRCKRVSGNALAGQWRCVKKRKAYRFEFSD